MFNVVTTHARHHVINGNGGNDTIDIATVSGTVTVNANAGDDDITIHSTGAGTP